MSQEFDKIVDLLREMQRSNSANADSIDRLLVDMAGKVDLMRSNTSIDVVSAYINELTRSLEDKYSVTLVKFQDIEHALRTLYSTQSDNIKGSDLREVFDVISKNINNFYTEARQEKAILGGIEARLSDMISNKSDKDDIVRTISLLRNDFENMNHSYKNTIDNVNTNLKSIISNLISIDPLKSGENTKAQVEIMFHAINDIVNKLQLLEQHNDNLSKILTNVATESDLKITRGILDTIVSKVDFIEQNIDSVPEKESVEEIKETLGDLNSHSITKEEYEQLHQKSEELINQTNDLKQSLSKIAKDVENTPSATDVEQSMEDLYFKIDNIAQAIQTAYISDPTLELNDQIKELKENLDIIKNIINDLNEALSSKIISAIENISFKNEENNLKEVITNEINKIPQKEDIDRLLNSSNNIFEALIEKTDNLSEKLDDLYDIRDKIDDINKSQNDFYNNQETIAQKLGKIAGDFEKLDILPEYKVDLDILKEGQNATIDKLSKLASSQKDMSEKLEDFSIIEENVEEIKDNQQGMSDKLLGIADSSEYIKEKIGSKLDLIPEYREGIDNLVNIQNNIQSQLSQIDASTQSIDKKIDFVDDSINDVAIEQKNISEKLTDYDKEFSNIYDKTTSIESWLIESNIKENSAKIIAQMQNSGISADFEFINDRTNKIIESLQQLSNSQDIENITESLVKIDSNIKQILNENTQAPEIADRLSNLERSISEIISRNEFNDFIDELKVCVTNLSANTGSCSENIEQMLKLRNEIEEKLNSFDFSQVLRVLNGKFDKLQEKLALSLTDEIIENIQTEIKDKLNTSEAFEGIKNSVEIVVDEVNDKIDNIERSLKDKIDSLKQEILENLTNFNQNNFDSEELDKITDYLENIKSLITDSDLSYKLSSIEDMLSLNNTFNESTLSQISERLSNLQDKINSPILSENLTDEVNELKNQISDIINNIDDSKVENQKYIDSQNTEIKEFLSKKLSDLRQNLSSMTVKIAETKSDDLVIQSVISEEKADAMLELMEELKTLNNSQLNSLNNKLSDLKNELKLLSTDINQNINNGMTEYLDELNSIKEIISNFEKTNSSKEVIKKLDDLYQEIISDELSPQNSLLIEEFHKDIENTFDKYRTAQDLDYVANINLRIDELKSYIEEAIENKSNSPVTNLKEIEEFKQDIEDFKTEYLSQLQDIENSIINHISLQNDELKSLLTIADNHDEILKAIDEIKTYFKSINNGDIDNIEINNSDYSDIQTNFDEFTKKIEKLSDDNFTLSQVIYSINQKIDEILNKNGIIIDEQTDITEEKPSFDFVHAFEILQKDITNLKANLGALKPGIKKEESSESDEVDYSKVEENLNDINNTWLDDLKDYISFINNDIASRLDSISSRLDVMVSDTASMELLEEISDIVYGVDEKITNLEDSDRQISAILEELDRRIAEISLNSNGQNGISEIKSLIEEQKSYIESLASVEKLDAFKNCIEELTSEVGNLATGTDENNVNIRNMKESIMSAVVTLFDQVSFLEESEDIKDFVEERTDEINKNIEQITKQLQQISSGVSNDYNYSLQDVETDLAKLRVALNDIKVDHDDLIKPEELTEITSKLHSISALVDSLTQDEMQELKSELSNIKEQTQFLIATSDKSYNALNNGIVGFEEIINDNLTAKVDQVTRMLEKSANTDSVIKQAMLYMGEWIDSASVSINKISANSEVITDNLQKLEKKISKFTDLEDQLTAQQQRISRLEANIDKLVTMVENMDDSSKKIDKIEKQITKLGTNIKKLMLDVD